LTTLRSGGVSQPPFDSWNMGLHVGDNAGDVAANRDRLLQACEELDTIQWLDQVHGTAVANAGNCDLPSADASYTRQPGIACAVMTADCLPLLIASSDGREVAAVHAGWRGLLNGVIESSLARFEAAPNDLQVWLGPAIGPQHFEVGFEVRAQFLQAAPALDRPATEQAFVAVASRQSPIAEAKYLANLFALARLRLAGAGVTAVYGGDVCTYSDPVRFYSYRRDHATGRMVSLIYRKAVFD
jgi:hypothetical protein